MVHNAFSYKDIHPSKKPLSTPANSSDPENDFEDLTLYQASKHLSFDSTFVNASTLYDTENSYPTYTGLDTLLPRPHLIPGCLTILHSPDKQGRNFMTRLFIKLILHYYRQGVVYIDCSNSFPAYDIIEATLEKYPDLDPQLPIRAVQLSRSFNYHQATETIKENLEPLLRDGFAYKESDEFDDDSELTHVVPKLVIVAGLPDLYLNPEAAQYLQYDGREEWFSIFELNEAIGYLRSLTIKYNCITLITSSTAPKSKTKPLGGRFLAHTSAIIAKVQTEGLALYSELIQHPFAENRKVLLEILKKKGKKRGTLPLSLFL